MISSPYSPESSSLSETAVPLCVDLDGTLIETDTLLEALLALIGQRPLMLFRIPIWILRGKIYLKRRVVEESPLDMTLLPVHGELLGFLRKEHRNGRRLILATATHKHFAQQFADHLNIFEEVLATDNECNLRGREKSRAICDRFGSGRFDYAANAFADIPIWQEASGAILVNTPRRLSGALDRRSIKIQQVFTKSGNPLRSCAQALRIHQWAKNLLVFAPLLLSHNAANPGKLLNAAVAFVCFSLCASGVYLLNDLFDLESDRRHATKKNRPLASGKMSIGAALILIPVLTAVPFLIGGLAVSPAFLLTLSIYWIATLAYSLWIKGQLLVDVMLLAALYTIRIIAGGIATHTVVSPWTFAFSVSLFLSLALVKRYSEIRNLENQEQVPGRAYQASDVSILSSAGLASGYMSVVVMALYINSAEVSLLYSKPLWLWPICLLQMYFVSRFWLLAHRGVVQEDPVIFALRDPVNLVLVAISLLFIYLAI